MAFVIMAFHPIAILIPEEAKTPHLGCKAYNILLDYRDRAVEDRLHKITITNDIKRGEYRHDVSRIRSQPYDPNGYGDGSSLYNWAECREGASEYMPQRFIRFLSI